MDKKDNIILAFESSCDETSVAVVKNGNEILSNIVATQVASHQRFGGVVPEVASRHHIEQITYCIQDALDEANGKLCANAMALAAATPTNKAPTNPGP